MMSPQTGRDHSQDGYVLANAPGSILGVINGAGENRDDGTGAIKPLVLEPSPDDY